MALNRSVLMTGSIIAADLIKKRPFINHCYTFCPRKGGKNKEKVETVPIQRLAERFVFMIDYPILFRSVLSGIQKKWQNLYLFSCTVI